MTCRLKAGFRPSTMTGFFGPISSTSVLSAIAVAPRLSCPAKRPKDASPLAMASNLHVHRRISSLANTGSPTAAGDDSRGCGPRHCRRARRRASKIPRRHVSSQKDVGNGTEHAEGRMDRDGPHGLPDGGAAAQGRLRRLDLEPHPRQGRAARQVRRQDRRQAVRSFEHGYRFLDRRGGQGRRAGLFRQGWRAFRQQDAGRVRGLLDHRGRGIGRASARR